MAAGARRSDRAGRHGAALNQSEGEPRFDPLVEAAPDSEDAITAEGERSSLFLSALLLKLRPLWPWLVVGLVGWIGWSELRQVDLLEVRSILQDTPSSITLLLLFFTAVNLAVAGLYDATALGSLKQAPRLSARWSVGVVTF